MLELIYNYYLDAIAFVLVATAGLALTNWWYRSRHGQSLSNPTFALIALITCGGVFTAVWSGQHEIDERREWYIGLAPLLAAESTALGHQFITADTTPDDPNYIALIEAQKRWISNNPAISDVYTRQKTPAGWVLLVDSETDYDRDGHFTGEREARTAIGEFYGALAGADELAAGQASLTSSPSSDKWGTWISILTPMNDGRPDGSQAILGIDFDAGDWIAHVLLNRSLPLVVAVLLNCIALYGATTTTMLRREVRVRREVEAALRASEAQLAAARARDRLRLDELETVVDQRTSELKIAATHDKLTGLPNRANFNDKLNSALERSKTDKKFKFAVLFLDFDRFKIINDSLGHEYGDLLLKAISGRLSRAMIESKFGRDPLSMIARLGGDEFCVLLCGIENEQEARTFAGVLLEIFFSSYQLRDREVHSSASIGITTSMMGYERGEDMLRDADNAMYRAKFAGKGRYVVFDQQMHVDSLMRLTIESDLRRAVERDELMLLFQPIVDIGTGQLRGTEALIRWNHPTRGRVGPGEFIELAEENGMIHDIGRWVLNAAVRQLAAWAKQFPDRDDLYVSVNVSRKELSPEYVEAVRAAIGRYGVNASRLVLEITETSLVREPQAARQVLDSLRKIGCRIYLDDFGIGYSALSCMSNFPLDGIKLDRSFLGDSRARRERIALVQAIITLARNLNLSFVAEGIETVEQIALLSTLECEFGQGYLFSQPVDAVKLAEMVETNFSRAIDNIDTAAAA
jgi:diguanylate cyclase